MIQSLSMLVHADSKVGKTTLGGTCPAPILLLDAEGGSKFLPLSDSLTQHYGQPVRLTGWNPQAGPPPRYDGTWDICVVYIREWITVTQVHTWLLQADHDFQSLVVDSISEIQRRCKANLKGTETMKIADWGSLLMQMDTIIRGLRDLTLHPTRPLRVAMFIAETRQNNNGKWKPYMQGQIETALPYWMDLVGYLFVEQVADENGQQTQPVRRLLISQHPQYEAGERVQGRLGLVVDNPNVYHMYTTLFGPITYGNGQAAVAATTAPTTTPIDAVPSAEQLGQAQVDVTTQAYPVSGGPLTGVAAQLPVQ